jgi:hypothetical protein
MLFQETQSASLIQLVGAGGFGFIIGWFVYFINRYRQGDVQFSDLTTVIGILGGGAILALFPAQTDLFGAYGIGLFAGFFGYFLFLMLWVRISDNFDVDWFLDGRRKKPTKEQTTAGMRKTSTSMAEDEEAQEGFE